MTVPTDAGAPAPKWEDEDFVWDNFTWDAQPLSPADAVSPSSGEKAPDAIPPSSFQTSADNANSGSRT